MVSIHAPEKSRQLDEARVARTLPVLHQLQFVSALYGAGVTVWLMKTRELWSPFRDEVDALWVLGAAWVGFLASSATGLAPFHPKARFGAPAAILVLLVAAGSFGIELREAGTWMVGFAGYLIGLLVREPEGWRTLGKRPDLTFEQVVRPMLAKRSSLLRIEDPTEGAASYLRRLWRTFGWVAFGSLASLAVLHLVRRVPSLDADQAAFVRLWNAQDLDSLRSWGVHSGSLNDDLERLAALPEWQSQWPRTGSRIELDEPVGKLRFLSGGSHLLWRVLYYVGDGRALPVDWIRIGGEWRIESFGALDSFGTTVSSNQVIEVIEAEEPDLPTRRGLER